MAKNKHNQILGSEIERSDDRIRQTGEVFTPETEVEKMIQSLSHEELQSKTFLDPCAGNGNFCVTLLKNGVPLENIYAIEYMEDNFFEMCERLNIQEQCYKLANLMPLLDEYVDVYDSSGNLILKKGNCIRCDAFFDSVNDLFDNPSPYVWVPLD